MKVRESQDQTNDLSRAEYAYASLKAMLRRGEMRAGQRVREIEIAERLGVSRTPVREALRRIATDGLVEVIPGRGMIVAEFDQQQVRQLYGLRGLLEGGAASFAARHASQAELQLMREILDRSRAAFAQPEEAKRLNAQFHRAIHEAAHNQYLAQALAQLSDSLALLPGTTFEEPGRAEEAYAEHVAILEALEKQAAGEAERLARRHIDLAGATRLRMMFASRG